MAFGFMIERFTLFVHRMNWFISQTGSGGVNGSL
jgi:hypothetical protein